MRKVLKFVDEQILQVVRILFIEYLILKTYQ